MVDWGLAGQIGGIGFCLVFVVLVILAIVTWLTGLVLSKTSAGKVEASDNRKKGA